MHIHIKGATEHSHTNAKTYTELCTHRNTHIEATTEYSQTNTEAYTEIWENTHIHIQGVTNTHTLIQRLTQK